MMESKMKPICFIPARGGSKGVKCKNIKKLDGIPLIVHAIKLAKNSNIFEKIVVSTDDQEIAEIAKKSGADILIRTKKLSSDESSMDEVILDAIPKLLSNYIKFNTLVNLDCTVPFVTKNDLKKLINILEKTNCDATCIVYRQHHNPYFNMVEPNSKGFLRISKKRMKKISTRQKAPIVYQLIGIFAMNVTRFMNLKKIYMPKTLPYEIPSERGLMIDTKYEFKLAEILMKNKKIFF